MNHIYRAYVVSCGDDLNCVMKEAIASDPWVAVTTLAAQFDNARTGLVCLGMAHIQLPNKRDTLAIINERSAGKGQSDIGHFMGESTEIDARLFFHLSRYTKDA